MKVVITEAAFEDMLRIGRFIREDSPARAESYVEELYGCCQSLAHMPEAFALVSDRSGSGIRRRSYGNYLIFYRVRNDAVEVLHVVHGMQDYERILFPDAE